MARFLTIAVALAPALALAAPISFRLTVVERDSGVPIPGAVVETTFGMRFVSDVNGVVAFHEPGLMDGGVFFSAVRSGFEVPPDFIGVQGRTLAVTEGGQGVLELVRSSFEAGPVPDGGTLGSAHFFFGGVPPAPDQYLQLACIDQETSKGVPLVELRTPYGTFVSDNHGLIAFHHPDAVNRTFTANVSTAGYTVEGADGGLSLTATPGAKVELRLHRQQVAERLYRLTGEGLERDAVLLGKPTTRAHPMINARVVGQDGTNLTRYRGKLFLTWGDTSRVEYPLGNFYSTGATALPLDAGGLSPEQGLDLDYFTGSDGFVRAMAPLGRTPGPVWLGGLVVVAAEDGGEALVANAEKLASGARPERRVSVRFDDDAGEFQPVSEVDPKTAPIVPSGHATPWSFPDGGRWVHYGRGVRLPATAQGFADPSRWEAFTARLPDGGLDALADGGLAFAWRADTRPMAFQSAREEAPENFTLFEQVRDLSGRKFLTHENDSVAWNEHRRRFVRLVIEPFTTDSFLGTIHYQEGDTPLGPWVYAAQVLRFPGYTFYNPRHHPQLDMQGGARIFFDGTYSTLFQASSLPTPRYDYNQLMHGLSLDDERLVLPVPLYVQQWPVTKGDLRPTAQPLGARALAWDRPGPGLIPVWLGSVCDAGLTTTEVAGQEPLFWAAGEDAGISGLVELPMPKGMTLERGPVRVLPNPLAVPLPVGEFLSDGLSLDVGPDRCVTDATAITLHALVQSAAPPIEIDWHTDQGAASSGPELVLPLLGGVQEVDVEARDSAGHVAHQRVRIERPLAPFDGAPSHCGCTASAPGALAFALLMFHRRRRASRLDTPS